MSGVMDFVFPKPVPQGPIEKKLALEDNRRIVRSIGAGQVAGAWFVAWALTVQLALPPILTEDPPPPEGFDDPPVLTFRVPDRGTARKPVTVRPPGRGPRAVSRNPVKESGRIQTKVIESRQEEGWADRAFATLQNIGRGVDQEKIEGAGRLTRTDPTRIAGRAGIKRDEFNPGITDGDEKGDPLDMAVTGRPGRIPTNGTRGTRDAIFGVASRTEIDVSSEERFRSSDEILAVVRAHSPGLRHLYNKHLKKIPGLGGKVTIRFAIAPSGLVVDAAIADGTTGSRPFEAEVLARVRTWKFEAIKAFGNDIVTVPFNFSE